MRPVAFIDLDNCISNDKWRWCLFDLHRPLPNDRYWRYHDACDRDMYHNSDVINLIRRTHDLVVATSRPEVVRYKTHRWLNRWAIPTVQCFMRPNDNHEPSTVLKKRMLDWAREQGFDVQWAIDDRTDILDMYADEGVRVCQRVFINEPEYTHP